MLQFESKEGALMTLTADALWLNSFFAGYDLAILSFAHKMAELAGSVLTPLNRVITLLGEKGLLFFRILFLFPSYEVYRKGHAVICL